MLSVGVVVVRLPHGVVHDVLTLSDGLSSLPVGRAPWLPDAFLVSLCLFAAATITAAA